MNNKKYCITTRFEVLYPREVLNKAEYTNDFQAALGAYIIYIQNPEVKFCTLSIIGADGLPKKIIAAFNAMG